MNIEDLLKYTIQKNASDLHLAVGYPPMVRVDGELQIVNNVSIDDDSMKILIDPVMSDSQKEFLEVNKETDFSYEYKPTQDRFRVNVFHEKSHLAGAFRLIPKEIRTFEELFLPDIMHKFTSLPQL